jgi:murein DD-endopeptidase MepM/ murein hydrolase activator NlpD
MLWAQPLHAQDGGSYVVAPGDTLGAIAARFGVSLDALVAVNGITDPNQITAGQQLIIPTTSGEMPLSAIETGLVHALPGDTIATVAARYDQEVSLITSLNRITETMRLFPGQPVKLPKSALPPEPLRFGLVTAITAPDLVQQGRTGRVYVTTRDPIPLVGAWLDQPLVFTPLTADGRQQFAFLPTPPLQEPGVYDLTVAYTTRRGVTITRQWPVTVADGGYGSQEIVIPEDKAAVMTPAVIQAERDLVVGIWSQVNPLLYWQDVFLRPIADQFATTSPFGTRRAYSVSDIGTFHAGQDFGAPVGAIVTAPAAGMVVVAEPLTVRGNAVIIDHGRGVFTGYWHLSEFKVEAGQVVNPGDVIGLVGNTGLSTGAHLHWELRVSGIAVDPMQFLAEPPFVTPEQAAAPTITIGQP